jgi:hypothetical protein
MGVDFCHVKWHPSIGHMVMKLLNILYRGEEGLEPDDVTFFCLSSLSTCSHAGLVHEGLNVLLWFHKCSLQNFCKISIEGGGSAVSALCPRPRAQWFELWTSLEVECSIVKLCITPTFQLCFLVAIGFAVLSLLFHNFWRNLNHTYCEMFNPEILIQQVDYSLKIQYWKLFEIYFEFFLKVI